MRRLHAMVFAVLFPVAALAACSSSTNNGGDGALDSGAANPTADASDAWTSADAGSVVANDASDGGAGTADAGGDPAPGTCTISLTIANVSGSNLADQSPFSGLGSLTASFGGQYDCTAVAARGVTMRFRLDMDTTLQGDVSTGGPYLDYVESSGGPTRSWLSTSGTVKITSTVGKVVHFSFTAIPMGRGANATGTFDVSGTGAATLP